MSRSWLRKSINCANTGSVGSPRIEFALTRFAPKGNKHAVRSPTAPVTGVVTQGRFVVSHVIPHVKRTAPEFIVGSMDTHRTCVSSKNIPSAVTPDKLVGRPAMVSEFRKSNTRCCRNASILLSARVSKQDSRSSLATGEYTLILVIGFDSPSSVTLTKRSKVVTPATRRVRNSPSSRPCPGSKALALACWFPADAPPATTPVAKIVLSCT